LSWDQRFFDPIILPGRKPLVTLRDAALFITKLRPVRTNQAAMGTAAALAEPGAETELGPERQGARAGARGRHPRHPDRAAGFDRCPAPVSQLAIYLPHCEREFWRTYRGSGRYCSDICVAAAGRERRAKGNAVMVKARSETRAAARADRTCIVCGEPLEAARSDPADVFGSLPDCGASASEGWPAGVSLVSLRPWMNPWMKPKSC
jgi:hypothetical protein